MWNKPTNKQLAKLPKLYATENVKSDEKKILMHFFIGGTDWFIAEYDPTERLFFGYTILNGDVEMAEWGYISLDELIKLNVKYVQVDRDLHWKTKTYRETMRDYLGPNWKKENKTLRNIPVEQHESAKIDRAKALKESSLREKALKVESKRSPASQARDERLYNKQTLPLNKENFDKWRAHPDQYDLQGIDTIKKLVKAFHAAKPFKIITEIKETAYNKEDLEKAREYLKKNNYLYKENSKYIELQAEIAKAIHQGIDPQLIDYAAHLSEDIPLSESLLNEQEWELLESRGYK